MKDTGEYYPFPGVLSNFSNDYYLISKTTTYVSTTIFRNRHGGYYINIAGGFSIPVASTGDLRIKVLLKGSEGLATIEDGVEREGREVCLERTSTISP